jgi:hypothetical protein
MTLRNACGTIEACEAKRGGLAALVEDLTLRDDVPRATRRRRVSQSGEHCHEWANQAVSVWRSRPRRL